MRVLIGAANLGEWGETDGVVTTYQNLIPRFSRAEIKVDMIAYGPHDRIDRHGNLTVIIHKPRLPLKIDPSRWIDPGIHQSSNARMIYGQKYDVVQSSTPCPMGLFARRVARRNSVPLISLYHTALDQYAEIRFRKMLGYLGGRAMGSFMTGWIRRYYNKADLILAPSFWVKGELEKIFKPPVDVLSRGVNTEKFHPRNRSRGNGKVHAIYVGRVALEKNLPMLVKIFEGRDDVELTVVGDGPYLKDMKKSLPEANFPGRLDGDALHRAYADGDIFVFPSRTDTLGNVVLEAMSSGVPAIVTNSMGPQELVDEGKTGFVVSNEEEFERALDRLIGDENLRKEMGRNAREFAKTRSWDSIYEQLLVYYDRVIEENKAIEV